MGTDALDQTQPHAPARPPYSLAPELSNSRVVVCPNCHVVWRIALIAGRGLGGKVHCWRCMGE